MATSYQAKPIRKIQGLHNFVTDIRECQTNFEEKEVIDEELMKIENAFKKENIDSYSNIKYLWKILFISFLGYDVKRSIGFQKCLKLVQSSSFGEVSIAYIGIVLFSSFNDNDIINDRIFIQTLMKHLSLPIDTKHDTITNNINSAYKIYALRCIANLCHISVEFSNQFIEIVENLCFKDNNHNDIEIIKKSLMALSRLVTVNHDYLLNIKRHKSSIESLLTHKNEGILNAALCLFNAILSNQYIVRQKQIDLIVHGYTREIQQQMVENPDNSSYSIMFNIPNNVIQICCIYYTGPPQQYAELLPIIINRLDKFIIKRECCHEYIYYQCPSPWTQIKLLKVLQYFDAPKDDDNRSLLQNILERIVTKYGGSSTVTSREFIEMSILFEAINVCSHYYDKQMCLMKAQQKLIHLINVTDQNNRYLGYKCLNKMYIAAKKQHGFSKLPVIPGLRTTINFSITDGTTDPIIQKEAFYFILNILNRQNLIQYFHIICSYMTTITNAENMNINEVKHAMEQLIDTIMEIITSSEEFQGVNKRSNVLQMNNLNRNSEKYMENTDLNEEDINIMEQEIKQNDPFSNWDDIDDTNTNWHNAFGIDPNRKFVVGEKDEYVLQCSCNGLRLQLKAVNMGNDIEFIGEYSLNHLKKDKKFKMESIESIGEYIQNILWKNVCFSTDIVQYDIGYVDKHQTENDNGDEHNSQKLENLHVFYEIDMNRINDIAMIWKLRHSSDFGGDQHYNLILKCFNKYSVSEYIEAKQENNFQNINILMFYVHAFMTLVSISSNDIIEHKAIDRMMEILSICPENVQLYAAAKTYDTLAKNQQNICDNLKVIELSAKILLLFGHLLVQRFKISIVSQFEHLNSYKCANDSKILKQIYDEFTVKFPNDITKSMITKANIQKYDNEEEENKYQETELISLTINDFKGRNITIIQDVKPSDTVITLKNKISEIGGYEPKNQILYYGVTKLGREDDEEEDGNDDLTKYNIEHGATLKLVVQAGNDETAEIRRKQRERSYIKRKALHFIDELQIECSRDFCVPFFIFLLIILSLFIFGAGVDLIAMIMASEQTQCGLLEGGDNLIMNPNKFLMVGGIFGFINLFIICSSMLATEDRIYDFGGRYIDNLLSVFSIFHSFVIVINIFIPIWCIIGFIEYTQLTLSYNNCGESMIGDMILSWSIIKMASSVCCLIFIFKRMTIPCIELAVCAYELCTFQSMTQTLCGFCGIECCKTIAIYTVYCCIGLLFIIVLFVIDMMALYIASSNEYDDEYNAVFIDPIIYLQIGGVFGLFNCIRLICILMQIINLYCCDAWNFMYGGSIWNKIWLFILTYIYIGFWILYDLFIFIWCIIGLIIFIKIKYIDIISNMIISWSIIRLLGQICFWPCLLNYTIFQLSKIDNINLGIATTIQMLIRRAKTLF